MTKKRVHNTVRTDYLENKIAYFRAIGQHRTAEEFIIMSDDIGAPIDKELIKEKVEEYKRFGL